jgi:quinol monooxygenase YgiN
MSLVVVATILPLPEHRDEVLSAFTTVIRRVHAEDEGCQIYALHTSNDRLVMVEKWANAEALRRHDISAAVAELKQALSGKLSAPPDIQVLVPHPAGSHEMGSL